MNTAAITPLATATFDPRYGCHVYLHKGVAYTSNCTSEFVQGIENFPMDEKDVVVVGYPKSGTNWLNIVLSRLYDDWETIKRTHEGRVPELSLPCREDVKFDGYGKCIASPPPRLSKTHLQFGHMPIAFREKKIGKAIYIRRNPKDVCDSFYNNISHYFAPDWTWANYFDAFMDGHVYFGSWLDNVFSWHEKGLKDNVLHLTYEGMKRDPRGAIERIVDFIGPVPPSRIDDVITATDFQNMKKSGLDRLYQPGMKRREAKVAAWKKRLTVEQSERMDALWGPKLKAAGIDVDYE
jgi:sulfotransferase family protein